MSEDSSGGNERCRKILSKKILKQARFQYTQKHSNNSLASSKSLIAQLGSLKIDEPQSIKFHSESAVNLIPNQPSVKNPTTSLSDCAGFFDATNLSSKHSLPSFSSIKSTSNSNSLTSPKQQIEPDYRNAKNLFVKKRRNKKSIELTIHKEAKRFRKLSSPGPVVATTCAQEAHLTDVNTAVCEITSYMENYFVLPKKMSTMAEMMYT